MKERYRRQPQNQTPKSPGAIGIERFHPGYHCLQGSTFGIPGVEQHTYFLRDADNATVIRNALIDNWNRANIPGMP